MNQKFGPQYALFYPCLLCVQVFNFGLKGRAKLRGTTPKGILSETKATPLPTTQNLTKLPRVVAFFRVPVVSFYILFPSFFIHPNQQFSTTFRFLTIIRLLAYIYADCTLGYKYPLRKIFRRSKNRVCSPKNFHLRCFSSSREFSSQTRKEKFFLISSRI